MKNSNDLNAISGLNNLGNTCFFNSVLQNLSQTPHLLELIELSETTLNKQLHIKHDNDYDSELTDYEEEEEDPMKKEKKAINGNFVVQKFSDESDTSRDENNEKDSKTHRSIRVPEIDLIIKEPQGNLTKQLGVVIKNMTSANTVVNPTTLFGLLSKRVPQFKGYQQQDSHELLRNLLECVRADEQKRLQAAILEVFNIPRALNQTNRTANKTNYHSSIDDLTKKRLKRYNRLTSYTLVDQIFGGHLLSSIVCSDCSYVMQRVEPFLDLSLPIISSRTDNLKTALTNQLPQLNPGRILRSTAKKITRKELVSSLRKETSEKEPKSEQKTPLEEFYNTNDDEDEKPSKHQTKKQIKMALKKAKKGKRNTVKEEEEVDKEEKNEQKDEEIIEDTESVENAEKRIEPLNGVEFEETPKDDSQKDVVEKQLDDLISKDLSESLKKINLTTSTESDENNIKQFKLENDLRIDSMESLGDRKIIENSTDIFSCTLQSCLLKFTSKESLNDKIECENCTKNFNLQRSHSASKETHKIFTCAVKQYLICDLPANLTIHLKRFMQHGYKLEKNNKLVEFPIELDMSPFVSKMCRNSMGRAIYTLNGIVEHSGRLNSGHYTAYVKQGNKLNNNRSFLGSKRFSHFKKVLDDWNKLQNVNSNESSELIKDKPVQNGSNVNEETDRWFYISDSHVSEVNVSKVLKAQAYILFYQRTH